MADSSAIVVRWFVMIYIDDNDDWGGNGELDDGDDNDNGDSSGSGQV